MRQYVIPEAMLEEFRKLNPDWKDGDGCIWVKSSLTSIRQRDKMASQGPWIWKDNYQSLVSIANPDYQKPIISIRTSFPTDTVQPGTQYMTGNPQLVVSSDDDAMFLSAARQDIANLLKEVDGLNELLEETLESINENVVDKEGKLDEIKGKLESALATYAGEPLSEEED